MDMTTIDYIKNRRFPMRRNVWIWLLCGILSGMLLSGCSSETSSSDILLPEDYVAVFQKVTESERISAAAFSEDTLYYLTCTIQERGLRSNTIHVYDLESGTDRLSYLLRRDGPNRIIQGMAVTAENNLVVCSSLQSDGSDDGDQGYYNELILLDTTGRELMVSQFRINTAGEKGLGFVSLAVDAEENIYAAYSGSGSEILVFDRDGQQISQIVSEDSVKALFTGKEGTVYGLIYEQIPGGGDLQLREIDLSADSFGKACGGLPVQQGYWPSVTAWGEHTALLSYGNSLYFYDWEKESCQELFNWTAQGVNSNALVTVAVLSEGRIAACISESGAGSEAVLFMDRADFTEEIPKEKTVLVIGSIMTPLTIAGESWLSEYNKNNTDYLVKIKMYPNQDVLNASIVAGDGPDILLLDHLDISPYVGKGILTDLYPLLDADEMISREDLVPSVLTAYEKDGKCYGLATGFLLDTLIGRTTVVGKVEDWTLDKVRSLSASMGEDVLLFNTTASGMLYTTVSLNLDRYVDWGNGTCYFDSEDFINLLEFASAYPDRMDADAEVHIQEGKLMTYWWIFYHPYVFKQPARLFGEDDIICIGYPTEDGGKNLLMPGECFAILESSTEKEGAWAYISSLFSEEYQEKVRNIFPSRLSVLREKFEEALHLDAGAGVNTVEENEAVYEAICNSVGTPYINTAVWNIIEEESAAYFAGGKTAQEVAETIQNRVLIYISENS